MAYRCRNRTIIGINGFSIYNGKNINAYSHTLRTIVIANDHVTIIYIFVKIKSSVIIIKEIWNLCIGTALFIPL